MSKDAEVALWLAGAALKAEGNEIAVLTVRELQADVTAGRDLTSALAQMRHFDRRPGDFGAEIIGPLLIPILIEAGKQLWAAYLKRVTEEAGKELADLSIDAVKAVARRVWSGNPDLPKRFAELVRSQAQREGLPPDQVERLAAAVASPRMEAALSAT